jgi:hypothetical protein
VAKIREEKPCGSVRHVIGCCGMKEFYGINGSAWSIEAFLDSLRKSARSNDWKIRYGLMPLIHKRSKAQYRPGGSSYSPISVSAKEEAFFTPTGQSKKLNELRKYIKANNLGVLRIGMPVKNPNSGAMLLCGMWEVNAIELLKHLRDTNPLKKAEVQFVAPVAIPGP